MRLGTVAKWLVITGAVLLVCGGVAAGLLYYSGGYFAGSERQVTGDIPLKDFDAVEIHGGCNVQLAAGKDYSVQLAGSERECAEYAVDVSGRRLTVVRKDRERVRFFSPGNGEVRIIITMPQLHALETSGSTSGAVSGFKELDLSIDAIGSSDLKVRECTISRLRLATSGSADIRFSGCIIRDADVDSAGSGEIALDRMDGGILEGKLSGSSRLVYHGTVSKQSVSTSGSSKVRQK